MNPLINCLLIATSTFLTALASPVDTQQAIAAVEQTVTNSHNSANSYGLPIQAVPYYNDVTLHYNVPIGIGTNPSQLFTAVIGLQWADLWVVSQYCTEAHGCGHHRKYNATKSPTHGSNGSALHLTFPPGPNLYGNISTDTVMLGENLKVEHHPFVELTYWQGYPHEFDAALGLAPQLTQVGHPDDSEPQLPSPFMGLMELRQLEKNSFALLLPYDRQDIGDLSFGTSHPEFHEGPVVSHTIYPANASTWQIEAPDISMRHRNGTGIFKHSLSGFAARFDSILPPLVAWLPEELVKTIMEATKATSDYTDCYVPQVPCDKISELPDLIFDFGNQEIVLTGQDYVGKAEWPMCFRGPYCTPMFGATSALESAVEDGTIVLGPLFLKKVYSVFDWDAKTVSFAMARHRYSGRI